MDKGRKDGNRKALNRRKEDRQVGNKKTSKEGRKEGKKGIKVGMKDIV